MFRVAMLFCKIESTLIKQTLPNLGEPRKMDDGSSLSARWCSLCTRLGVASEVQELFWRQLDAAYTSPGRFYHTLDHITQLFEISDWCAHELEERDAVELAIWFHDIVYDARGGGNGRNEHESAAIFRTFAAEAACLSAALVDAVSHWIELTTDHRCGVEDTSDARLFMDMDMAVLALPAPEYDAYALQVRAEYAHVSNAAWCYGRSRFLSTAASAPHIYHTARFQGMEGRARANMRRECAALRAHLALILGSAAALAAGGLALFAESPSVRMLGAAPILVRSASWLALERPLIGFPWADSELPSGGPATTVIFAASFNPPHLGHLGMLRKLSERFGTVIAAVAHNPSKVYAVSPEERRGLLASMVAGAGLDNVQPVLVGGYVWKYAHARRVSCLFRGVRSIRSDGFDEAYLALLNMIGPLMLGPLSRPMATRFLAADPRHRHISSTLIRERLASHEGVSGLVPDACAPAVAELYGPGGGSGR